LAAEAALKFEQIIYIRACAQTRKDCPNAGYFCTKLNQVLLLQKIPPPAARSVRACAQRHCSLFMSEIHQPLPPPSHPVPYAKKVNPFRLRILSEALRVFPFFFFLIFK